MGNWWDEFVETAEDAVDAGGRLLGETVDAVTNVAGDVLDKIGLDDIGDAVEDFGDTVADKLGATPGEMQLGESDDPKDLVHGDPGALREAGAKVAAFGQSFDQAGTGLQGISAGDFTGESADAYQQSMRTEVAKWLAAADACESAATGFGDIAAAVEWGQQQAAEAIRLWKEAERLRAEWEQKVNDYNDAVDDYNAGNTTVKPTDPGPDPSPAVRQQAQDTLKKGRDHRNQVGDQVAGTWNGAADKAPPEPPAGQRALATAFDIKQVADTMGGHFSVGLVNGLTDIVKTVRTINPTDPYNMAHPADYLRNVSAAAAGLTDVAAHPEKLVTGFIGDGWSTDPAQSLGVLTSQVLPIGPPGASVAASLAKVGVRTGIKDGLKQGIQQGIKDGVQTGVKDAAANTVKHSPSTPSSAAKISDTPTGHDGTPTTHASDTPAPKTDNPTTTAEPPAHTPEPSPPEPARQPDPGTPEPQATPHGDSQTASDRTPSQSPDSDGASVSNHTPHTNDTPHSPEPAPEHRPDPAPPRPHEAAPTPADRSPSAPAHNSPPDRPGPGPSESTTPTHGDQPHTRDGTPTDNGPRPASTHEGARHPADGGGPHPVEQRPDGPTARDNAPAPGRPHDAESGHPRTPAAAADTTTHPHTPEPPPRHPTETPTQRTDPTPSGTHPSPSNPATAAPHGSPHATSPRTETPAHPSPSARPEPISSPKTSGETIHAPEPKAAPTKSTADTPAAVAKPTHEPAASPTRQDQPGLTAQSDPHRPESRTPEVRTPRVSKDILEEARARHRTERDKLDWEAREQNLKDIAEQRGIPVDELPRTDRYELDPTKYTDKLGSEFSDELKRQKDLQEHGYNTQTVQQTLDNMERARQPSTELRSKLRAELENQGMRALRAEGYSPAEAKMLAKDYALEQFPTAEKGGRIPQQALHNPDGKMGGPQSIFTYGDAQVNNALGKLAQFQREEFRQWLLTQDPAAILDIRLK